MSATEATERAGAHTTSRPVPHVRARLLTIVPACGLITMAVLVLAPTVGSTPISLSRAFDPSIPWADNVDAQIFFIARLPRVLAGGLVGATLASAGVVMQALLRNPLATPFTLGVSTGAALGAMLALAWHLDERPVAGGRHLECILLGADHLRGVHGRLRRLVP